MPPLEAPRIGIVLPLREMLSKANSGAVGLCMRDFTLYSRFRESTSLLGTNPCDLVEVPYLQQTGWRRWYLRDRSAYARRVVEVAVVDRLNLIEVQNRPTIASYLRGRLPNAELVLHLHNDPQTMEGSRSVAERARLFGEMDAVYCVSHFVRQRFVDGLAGDMSRVHTLHNGMDIARLPAQIPKERIVFFAGRLVREKGVIETIKAFRLARSALPGWRLVVAGADKMGLFSGKVPEITGDLADLGEACRYAGMLGHADVMSYFAKAELSVVPTLTEEPLGRTAQEAMACGSALITSGSGGLKETVGDVGLIVNPVTPRALADAIVALALDDTRRRSLQAAGATRMAAMFDIRKQASALDDIRQGILARRQGVAAG
jgi:UDP-glucose:(glucosyl)LPS alpha-1,2-glucosyltransferase